MIKYDNPTKLGLYIHIPFCKKKCFYCHFTSFVLKNPSLLDIYLNALIIEIKHKQRIYKEEIVDTIYIGGGSPSLLPIKYLSYILTTIYKFYSVSQNSEITLEINPENVDENYIKHLKDIGINRLSIGIQRLDNKELEMLGRINTTSHNIKALEYACKYFDNVSIDVIYNIPDENPDKFLKKMMWLLKNYPIKHISAYELTIEDGSIWTLNDIKQDDNIGAYIYENLRELLLQYNFVHYEVSNYAKYGFFSKHNIKYWKFQKYLGFGVSSHSFYNKLRFYNPHTFNKYLKTITTLFPYGIKIYQTKKDFLIEYIYLAIRQMFGGDLNLLKENFFDYYERILTNLSAQKEILIKNNKFFLVEKYWKFADLILWNILNDVI